MIYMAMYKVVSPEGVKVLTKHKFRFDLTPSYYRVCHGFRLTKQNDSF